MQTFLFNDLKAASRYREVSKIMTLGPYALCLSYILAKSNNPLNLNVQFVYRGMKMDEEIF